MGWPTRTSANGAGGVHVGVGEQAEFFELVGGEEVGFVDDEHDSPSSFGDLGGEGVGGLGDEGSGGSGGSPPRWVTMVV